ncbi:putative tyrosine phosphatase protein [Zalerion maritima]|uniref:Tyrosine phosphatase protein n=1 Tax=Zalerion maritima TaxID=339359 RepID=A0AAD5RLR0_9PEZI|nr:putative tyrosine phosphatase protein [Zalerion maritima]
MAEGNNTETATGSTIPTWPPFHDVGGIANFRDIGGYQSTLLSVNGNPKVVRRGLVFRCADPSGVTDEGIETMNRLGIRKVYDLRSNAEVSKPGKVREWEGAERVYLPVFLDEDYSPQAIAERWHNYATQGCAGFVRAYNSIIDSSTSSTHPYKPLATLINHLVTLPSATATSSAFALLPDPILLHCTAGKDRTGVLCAIVLSLLGIPDHSIAEEYGLTDIGLGSIRSTLVSRLLAETPLKWNKDGAERMASSRSENMVAFLQEVRRTYGSVEGMVQAKLCDEFGGEAGVASVVGRLRGVMLEDAAVDAPGHH